MQETPKVNPVNIEIDKTNEYLAKFEDGIGLTNTLNKNTIDQARELLVSDWQELKNMDAIELAVNACILTDYGMTIQRIINREKAIIHWAKERLKNVSAQKCEAFYKSLNYKRVTAEIRLTRIENLHFSIKNLADKIEWLSKLKGNYNDSARNAS